MPTQAIARNRPPVIVDQSSLTDAVAAQVVAQLRDIFSGVTLQVHATTPPVAAPMVNVSPASVSVSPQIDVEIPDLPIQVTTMPPDMAPLAACMSRIETKLDVIASLLGAPVTTTVTRNAMNEIVTTTQRRG